MLLSEKHKQLLGRQSFLPSGLKVLHTEIAKISKKEYNELQVDLRMMYFNFSEKDDSFARISVSKDKDYFVITKDLKSQFFVHNKRLNLLTQKVSIEEVKTILSREKSLQMRFDNCKNLYSEKDANVINLMIDSIKGKSKEYVIDDDFDYTL